MRCKITFIIYTYIDKLHIHTMSGLNPGAYGKGARSVPGVSPFGGTRGVNGWTFVRLGVVASLLNGYVEFGSGWGCRGVLGMFVLSGKKPSSTPGLASGVNGTSTSSPSSSISGPIF